MDTSKFATKSDLKAESKSIRTEVLRVEEKVENVQDEIKELRIQGQRQEGKLDKLQNTLDGFVGRVDNLTIDNEVGVHHTRELQIRILGIEKRVKQLESSK